MAFPRRVAKNHWGQQQQTVFGPMDEDALEQQYKEELDNLDSKHNASPSTYLSHLNQSQVNQARKSLNFHLKGKTDVEILHMSKVEVQIAAKLNDEQVTDFLVHTSLPFCANMPTCSALDLKNDQTESKVRTLSLGCPNIDKYLKGGILSKGITEIAGESGSGKTQLCLQLCLQVQLPYDQGGLQGGVCYISTEGEFPSKRLLQLLHGFKKKHPDFVQDDSVLERMSDRVFVQSVPTIEKLWTLTEEKLPQLLQKERVKLVIIDSIAALFRFEYSGEEAIERSKLLWKHANQLKLLSDRFNIPIVVVNQVSDLMNDLPGNPANVAGNGRVIPALGLSWSNCVNTRIMLSRTTRTLHAVVQEAKRRKMEEPEVVVRKLHVLLASHLPNVTCEFVVNADGISGIS